MAEEIERRAHGPTGRRRGEKRVQSVTGPAHTPLALRGGFGEAVDRGLRRWWHRRASLSSISSLSGTQPAPDRERSTV